MTMNHVLLAVTLFFHTQGLWADGVAGKVRNNLGVPVADARVRLSEMKVDAAPCGFHSTVDSTFTDSTGSYGFQSLNYSGFYDVSVFKDGEGGYCTFVEAGSPDAVLDLDIPGPDTLCTIRGVSLLQGNPSARAPRVGIILMRGYAEVDTLETDSAGRFSLVNLPPDPMYALLVRDESVEDISYDLFDLQPGDIRSVRMELKPKKVRVGTGSVSGRVVDGADSSPVAGAFVRLDEKASEGMPIRDSTWTDAQGRYSFTSLPAAPERAFGYNLWVGMDKYRMDPPPIFPLQEGENKVIDLTLKRIVSLRVQVEEAVLSGMTLGGAAVVLALPAGAFPISAQDVDGQGQAVFGGLSSGDYEVTVARPGFRTRLFRMSLDVRKWEDTLVAPLVQDLPATSRSIRGTLSDASGKPVIAGIYFTCSLPEGRLFLFAQSGTDGGYLISGIPGDVQLGVLLGLWGKGDEPVSLQGAETRLDLVYSGGPGLNVLKRESASRIGGAGMHGRDLLGRRNPSVQAAGFPRIRRSVPLQR